MTLRALTLLASAALAAAAPAAATAKPYGPHPGKGHGLERFERVQPTSILADEDGAPIAEDDVAPIAEPVVEKPRRGKADKADKGHKGRGRGRSKGKMTVFKGRVVSTDSSAGTVTVRVRHRNRWARVFRGEEVTFSLETARVLVADTDGDGTHGVSDIAVDDRVLVKARIARGAADDGTPIAALRLIDQTSPYDADEDDVEDEDEREDDDVVTEPAPVDGEPAPDVEL